MVLLLAMEGEEKLVGYLRPNNVVTNWGLVRHGLMLLAVVEMNEGNISLAFEQKENSKHLQTVYFRILS